MHYGNPIWRKLIDTELLWRNSGWKLTKPEETDRQESQNQQIWKIQRELHLDTIPSMCLMSKTENYDNSKKTYVIYHINGVSIKLSDFSAETLQSWR